MKPCITTWPEIVPTVALESPEREQREREQRPGGAAEDRARASCARPRAKSTSCRPQRKNVLAAITIIATLISPAIVIAITTSIFV